MNVSIAPNIDVSCCPQNSTAQEIYLSTFIRFVLSQTRTNCYPSEVALQLLDLAWEAQKQLWQIRNQPKSLFQGTAGREGDCCQIS